jgi:hypothetical protein
MEVNESKLLGNCPICDREMYQGSSVNEHHLIPKTFGGKKTVLIHRICHQKIHSIFSERELEKVYHTIESLIQHDEMKKFIKWLRNKPATFYVHNDRTAARK